MKNLLTGISKEQKMLLASVTAGIIAAALVFVLVHEMRMRMEQKMDPVEVVAAAAYIPAFADITTDKLKVTTAAHTPRRTSTAWRGGRGPWRSSQPETEPPSIRSITM